MNESNRHPMDFGKSRQAVVPPMLGVDRSPYAVGPVRLQGSRDDTPLKNTRSSSGGLSAELNADMTERLRVTLPVCTQGLLILLVLVSAACAPTPCHGVACDFLRLAHGGNLFAVDPDVALRRFDPRGDSHVWNLGESHGIPPLFLRSKVQGHYDRVDFFYPLGCWEESPFRSKLRFSPLLVNEWSKLPPFDGYSRCLTMYHGRSDRGRNTGFLSILRVFEPYPGGGQGLFLVISLY